MKKTTTQQIRESMDRINEAPIYVPGGFRGTTRDDRQAIIKAHKDKVNTDAQANREKHKQFVADQGLGDLPANLFKGKCPVTPDELYAFLDTSDPAPVASAILSRKYFKSPFLKDPENKEKFSSVVEQNPTYLELVRTYLTDALEGTNIDKNQTAILRFILTAEKQFENKVLQKRRGV